MKVAITGSSGTVGRGVILEALEHTSHQLRLIDVRDPAEKVGGDRVEYFKVDMRNYDAFYDALVGVDALIHLAVGGNKGGPPFESQDIHNGMVVMSFNALQGEMHAAYAEKKLRAPSLSIAAANLGMRHVVLASSVNAIGALFSNDPKYDYFPLDENHPYKPEEGYSVG